MVGVKLEDQAPMLRPNQMDQGALTEWGRLSTDDLLIKIVWYNRKKYFQKKTQLV
jgi:hypothetical protein